MRLAHQFRIYEYRGQRWDVGNRPGHRNYHQQHPDMYGKVTN